jgi:hypothetical protein
MICSGTGGVENLITDNLKVKASKAMEDTRVAVRAAYDDATVAACNSLKEVRVETQKVSENVKISFPIVVSDAKIAAHETGLTLKKRQEVKDAG